MILGKQLVVTGVYYNSFSMQVGIDFTPTTLVMDWQIAPQ
jgi:hypothetical protein